MGLTTISPHSSFPATVKPAEVEYRATWADPWLSASGLEVVRAVATAGAQDLASCELQCRYGMVQDAGESGFTLRQFPSGFRGLWIRIKLEDEMAIKSVQWIGRISSDPTRVHIASSVASGLTTFAAYGPQQELRKCAVGTSFWYDSTSDEVQELEWVPSFNLRDSDGLVIGNRTPDSHLDTHDSHHFCSDRSTAELWTPADVATYILKNFMEYTDGPVWELAGQVSAIESEDFVLSMDSTSTVDQVLRRIISTRQGLDYRIVYCEGTGPSDPERFEVQVFSVATYSVYYQGHTLPANPDQVILNLHAHNDAVEVIRELTHDHKYCQIRVRGGRIVACCSLVGNSAHVTSSLKGTLSHLVAQSLITAYKAAEGEGADPEEHDAFRKQDRFRNVFRLFGAPMDWNQAAHGLARTVDSNGDLQGAGTGDFQNVHRTTKSWTPLSEDVDYSVDPPVDSDSTRPHDLLPPIVWLYDHENARYVSAEEMGISVSVSSSDLAVYLSAAPNYLLALNHWNDAQAGDKDPLYDWEEMVVTLAFPTDQRLQLVHGDALPDGDGSIIDIDVPEAELWYVAPGTFVRTDNYGDLVTVPGAGLLVIRNDVEKLRRVMAGAIARYRYARGRGQIRMKGLWPWAELLGQILATFTGPSGSTESIDAPITSITWNFDAHGPTTTLQTGFAQ